MSDSARLGRYILKRKIATGGMAEIWLAEQAGPAGFAKEIVIKRILPHLADDQKFVEMFLDEARLAAAFSHPNIAQIFDLGEADGSYYIAMEYIDGFDLEGIVERAIDTGHLIPVEVAARLIADAAQGLDYAHSFVDKDGKPMGLVHRDISPQNILVSKDGVAKVVDFGVAKARNKSNKTQTGAVKGKLSYMSPEQITASKDLDGRSDIFALGIVLYELVTTQRPFGHESELLAVSAILNDAVRIPDRLTANVPGELEQIILKALDKDRDRRFQEAAEMQSALESFLARRGTLLTQRDISAYLKDLFSDDPSGGIPGKLAGPVSPFLGGDTMSPITSAPTMATELPEAGLARNTEPQSIYAGQTVASPPTDRAPTPAPAPPPTAGPTTNPMAGTQTTPMAGHMSGSAPPAAQPQIQSGNVAAVASGAARSVSGAFTDSVPAVGGKKTRAGLVIGMIVVLVLIAAVAFAFLQVLGGGDETDTADAGEVASQSPDTEIVAPVVDTGVAQQGVDTGLTQQGVGQQGVGQQGVGQQGVGQQGVGQQGVDAGVVVASPDTGTMVASPDAGSSTTGPYHPAGSPDDKVDEEDAGGDEGSEDNDEASGDDEASDDEDESGDDEPSGDDGSIRITVTAPGRHSIYIDGERVGRLPGRNSFDVSAGRHRVRVVNDRSGEEQTQTVNVRAGRSASVRF